ncbi:unnamed protein product [Adineta steineri]|uniref:Fe2OG dioxygenase domain-containing protein n=1 Tax=Adineta steineri TaxID=433720 RepID=A0A813W338_9BILA|nr:unnamed protein product [Adineta steineri]CAF1391156.1 unnamed protein product [Adineta steineri]CAF3514030.1 unnamed protein product [Adineta steineri]CAF3694149.1 unnamed protein product [Adineta steineri]
MAPLLPHPEFKLDPNEPIYDPDIHLSLTEPDFLVLLDKFQRVSKAPKIDRSLTSDGDGQLAYTSPFRVLSDEGYRVLCMIIDRDEAYQKNDDIATTHIRDCGYRSKWIQDFNRCPRVLNHLSNITGDVQLLPVAYQLFYSQVNIGIANGLNVTQYHCDSVPYVLLLRASDMSKTIGGDLQMVERESKEAFHLIEQYKGEVPDEYTRKIEYGDVNSCVLMQGSRIAHRVTPIDSCSEPRITVVNSYITSNPSAFDYARYSFYKKEPTAALEYAIHKTWRANGQMLELAIGNHPYPTRHHIVERLTMAINELTQARDLISDSKSDQIGYFDQKNQETYKDRPVDITMM